MRQPRRLPAPPDKAPAKTETPAKAEAPAKPEAPVAVLKEDAENGKIHLVFDKESWTEVRQAGGKVVFSRQNPPGSDAWVDGQPPFDFVIGNAPSVKLYYRGSPVDLAPYTKISVARLQLK